MSSQTLKYAKSRLNRYGRRVYWFTYSSARRLTARAGAYKIGA